MRSCCLVAVLALSALCASYSPAADVEPRWPQSPDELVVSLSVKEALEEGPVVCTVTLKNVSKAPLKYATSMFEKGAFCMGDAGWKLRKEPSSRCFAICGNIGPYERCLYPGDTASETFYLHPSFLSIPAGKAAIRFGWRVYHIVERPDEKALNRQQLDLLFELKDAQTVEILSATKTNIDSVRRRLETRFPEAAKNDEAWPEHVWPGSVSAADFVGTIDGCRHPEFAPLLLQAIDRLRGENFRRHLVATLYESFATSDEGFAALAEHITSADSAADEVFDYWTAQDRDFEESRRRQEELKKPPTPESDPDKARLQEVIRSIEQEDEEAWQQSKRHLDTRLTQEQFGRLRSVKNVWVRTLLYSYYPSQCPPEWVEALLHDLNGVLPPPGHFRDLMTQLDDDDFEVRERASAELIERGPKLAWHLWTVRLDGLSPEAAGRLRRVLQKVEKPELPHLWQRTIAHLGWEANEPQNRRLLDALRTSDCANLISQAAQLAFDENKKRTEEEAARKRGSEVEK